MPLNGWVEPHPTASVIDGQLNVLLGDTYTNIFHLDERPAIIGDARADRNATFGMGKLDCVGKQI